MLLREHLLARIAARRVVANRIASNQPLPSIYKSQRCFIVYLSSEQHARSSTRYSSAIYSHPNLILFSSDKIFSSHRVRKTTCRGCHSPYV